MRILLLMFAFSSVANALSTTPYTPTGPIDNAGMPGRTVGLYPAWLHSLATRNQMIGERTSGATASHVDPNPMGQMLSSMFSLGGSGAGGGSGGSGNAGGLSSLFGGGHADIDPMSQMFPSMFSLGRSGTSGSSNLGGLGSLFGGGGNSLQNMALLGTGTDQLLNLAGMDCMMNSAAPSTAMDPACMMLMMQQMTTGI